MKELLKKFSITILSILRHGSKQEQPCINLSEFIFLNDNLPYLSIDNLFVAFKKDTNNLSEDIIKSILDQDHFFDYLNDILLTSECKFIIKNINGVDYIAAKTRHSKDIINLNYQKKLNLIPPFYYNNKTLIGHVTTSYELNFIISSGLKPMSTIGIPFILLHSRLALINLISNISNLNQNYHSRFNIKLKIVLLIVPIWKLIEKNFGFSIYMDNDKFDVLLPKQYEYIPISFFDIYQKKSGLDKFELMTENQKYLSFS